MSFRIFAASRLILAGAAFIALAGQAEAANLIVNGGFEDSDDGFTTPPGWTNIGPSNGVVPYAAVAVFNLTPYEGENFYTIGGLGTNGNSQVGWGITQSVATTIGNTYRLTFGYTGENGPGLETILGVNLGGSVTQYTLTSTPDGFFGRPFTTAMIDYVATNTSTAISFTLDGTNEQFVIGNADPILDGISFEQIAEGTPAVPEPATWAMMIAGFGAVGASLRRRTLRAALN